MYAPYLTPRSRSLSPMPSPTKSNLAFVYTTKLPVPFEGTRRVSYYTFFKMVRYLLMFLVFTLNPLVFLRVLVVVNLVRYIWWP